MFKKVDGVLFPANIKCLGCGIDLPEKRDIEICDDCLKLLEPITENKCCTLCGTSLKMANLCPHCKENKREFNIARSAYRYNEFMAGLIKRYKYNNQPYMCATFAHMLSQKYKEIGFDVDCVIPVPISKQRKRQRGYNQSELIAKIFAEENHLPLILDVLLKDKETEHQADLNYEDRQKNIVGSFKVKNKQKIAGKNVLIIDDVFTTGATTSACAKVLKKAKVQSVSVLCVASTSILSQSQNSKVKSEKIKISAYVENQ